MFFNLVINAKFEPKKQVLIFIQHILLNVIALFPYPIQSLLVEQRKLARKEIVEDEEPQENVGDDLVKPVDCLFYC